MQHIADSILETIGHTPLVRLARLAPGPASLLAKVEARNPGGSIKDRAALFIIQEAEMAGALRPGSVIVEPTSGNTGVGLAWIGRLKGYPVILTMPESMSAERRMLLTAMGAQLVLTPAAQGMKGAIEKAESILKQTPGAWMPMQFANPSNAHAHEYTTAQEIWRDTDGKVDILVAGVGTGGTLTGTARGLRKYNPSLQVVAVEPASSPLLSGGEAGPHAIQGIGANFIPSLLDRNLINEVIAVRDDDAMEGTRELIAKEGILAGISSGAAAYAAQKITLRPENAGKTIVVILPDTGERYLSTGVFQEK